MEVIEVTEQPEQAQPSDKRLDFGGPDFDPLVALHTPGLQPPVPDAPVLDNVSKCAALLPPDPTQQQAAATNVLSEVMNCMRFVVCIGWARTLGIMLWHRPLF